MRRLLWSAACAISAALVGLAPVQAGALKARPVTPNAVKEVTEATPTCGKHGTTVEFLDTPQAAAKQAKKEGKLVFVLHVSGNFEDPRFT